MSQGKPGNCNNLKSTMKYRKKSLFVAFPFVQHRKVSWGTPTSCFYTETWANRTEKYGVIPS